MTDEKESPGTLKLGEFHPSAHGAYKYIKYFLTSPDSFLLREAIASSALSGNRTAEICYETLRRVIDHEPVSDRYLLGLAFFIMELRCFYIPR